MTSTRPLLLAFALPVVVGVASGCPTPPEDVDLGTLQLRVWQPEALASGSGDLLEDAARVDVTLVVDGKEQKVALDDDLSAVNREAAAEGSDVEATLRTSGGTLPDALGRSGRVRLEPGGGDVSATAILAPADVEHALSISLPNPRSAMAVCASDAGRLWAVGGLLGGTLAGGSFVLDRADRVVREGPALADLRAFAACAPDDEGGVYLAGGCSADGSAPVGSLAYSETGELGASFVEIAALPGAGCHTRLVHTSAGTLVALFGSALARATPDGDVTTLTLPAPRFAGVLAAFPSGERVLVSGGFTDATLGTPTQGSLVVDLADDASVPITLVQRFRAATREGDALIGVDGADVSRVTADGDVEAILEDVVPSAFAPTQIASLHDGRYALLGAGGSSILVVGGDAPKTIVLGAAREHLWADPGGALVLFGGGVDGVSLVVVD